jgi:hypothetical protein
MIMMMSFLIDIVIQNDHPASISLIQGIGGDGGRDENEPRDAEEVYDASWIWQIELDLPPCFAPRTSIVCPVRVVCCLAPRTSIIVFIQ